MALPERGISGGHLLLAKISEKYLETVIPCEGRPVIIVKGELARKTGTLKKINHKEFCVTVEGMR